MRKQTFLRTIPRRSRRLRRRDTGRDLLVQRPEGDQQYVTGRPERIFKSGQRLFDAILSRGRAVLLGWGGMIRQGLADSHGAIGMLGC